MFSYSKYIWESSAYSINRLVISILSKPHQKRMKMSIKSMTSSIDTILASRSVNSGVFSVPIQSQGIKHIGNDRFFLKYPYT